MFQGLNEGRLEDKKVGGYAVICERSSQSFLYPPLEGGPKSLISRRGLNNGSPNVLASYYLKQSKPHPYPLLVKEREYNSPKRTYSPKLASLFTPHCSLKEKVAFTLSEVLITLGIIGVVAALTIPVLMGNYKKQAVETSLKKYHSMLNQAIKLSEAANGPAINWNWQRTTNAEAKDAFFKQYFEPYIAVVDTQKARHVLDTKLYYKIYDSAGRGPIYYDNQQGNWNQMPDGGAVQFSFNSGSQQHLLGYLSVVLPTASNLSHLIAGKDVFQFAINVSPDGSSVSVYPNSYWNWSCKSAEIQHDDFIRGCKAITGTSGIGPQTFCAMLVYCNGWKFPEDYPIKF